MMLSSRTLMAARALLRPSSALLRRNLHAEGTHMNQPAYRLVLVRCVFFSRAPTGSSPGLWLPMTRLTARVDGEPSYVAPGMP